MEAFSERGEFAARHIGPSDSDIQQMLSRLSLASLDELTELALPSSIRVTGSGTGQAQGLFGSPVSEAEAAAELAVIGARNQPMISMIGLGYYDTVTPAVIRRNLIEDPGWYTAYTPYQPEISQGRLEALLNFQTMISDLSGLQYANASLLDEPTAAAEAMGLIRRANKGRPPVLLVDSDTHPQTLAVLRTRAEPVGVRIVVRDLYGNGVGDEPAFGVILGYPTSSGAVRDPRPVIQQAHASGALTVLCCDLLALTLLADPASMGADVVVGSAQRFGVPMSFGGPHAGFMAVRPGLERQLPGRLVGVSRDARGRQALRLAVQTREQHIRRERATSNICTSQALLAMVASAYAVYHGPQGLRRIAARVHGYARVLADGLVAQGWELGHTEFFDTLRVKTPGRADSVLAASVARGINLLRVDSDEVGLSVDEVTTEAHVRQVLGAFAEVGTPGPVSGVSQTVIGLPAQLASDRAILTHRVFHDHHSETALMRYLRRLKDADMALDRTMIPLGSCTMKLNAAAALEPISRPEWASIHPFAPADQTAGYRQLTTELAAALAEITGYDAVSLQPNAGSQGELAGLLAIRGYLGDHGGQDRDVCLIPASAHGTNAASAVLAGMRVVVVACDDAGNVDFEDLTRLIGEHRGRLAALMVTYPSTHGVYEPNIVAAIDAVHEAGGQVYVDGANLNALVGVSQPGSFGADVSHLNLHKTFAIPHGGGGPGVGPVAVRAHLAAYLPGHPLRPDAGPAGSGWPDRGQGPVSGAPWGSAGVLTISWMYLRLLGRADLRRATQVAVLSANYLAAQLAPHYRICYTGPGGLVAHECILDLRELTRVSGVTAEDVAKRLIDYGFHAPTMSFPVAGTLMVEPTESEPLRELDRFVAAMAAIRAEIEQIAVGEMALTESPLRRAPHTAADLVDDWDRPYSREQAVFPTAEVMQAKYWPPVNRIDAAFGDRNLFCTCPAVGDQS